MGRVAHPLPCGPASGQARVDRCNVISQATFLRSGARPHSSSLRRALPQADVKAPSPSINRLWRIALLVAVGDLSSKWLAARLWSERPARLTDWVSMAVVHNDAGAFGLSVGAYTWQLNLALTLAAVVFIVPVARDLAQIDRRALTALGLIVGGAMGNLASLVLPPRGVMDFISVNWSAGHSLVLNVADVAAYAGLAMILRTGFRIAGALRRESSLTRELGLGSVFAAKLAARRQLGGAVPSAPRPLLREELVVDWSHLAEHAAVRADAPMDDGNPVSVEYIEIPVRPGLIMADAAADLPRDEERLQREP